MRSMLTRKAKISEWRLRVSSKITSSKEFVRIKSKTKEKAKLPVKWHHIQGEIFQAPQNQA